MELEVVVTDLQHDDIVNFLSGVDSYCSYWCSSWKLPDLEYKRIRNELLNSKRFEKDTICTEDVYAEALITGVVVNFEVDDEDTIYVLTLDKLKKAIGTCIANDSVSKDLKEEWDAEDCDIIIQQALFDEVVYG